MVYKVEYDTFPSNRAPYFELKLPTQPEPLGVYPAPLVLCHEEAAPLLLVLDLIEVVHNNSYE